MSAVWLVLSVVVSVGVTGQRVMLLVSGESLKSELQGRVATVLGCRKPTGAERRMSGM